MHQVLYISEQYYKKPIGHLSPYLLSVLTEPKYQKLFKDQDELVCYELLKEKDNHVATTNYFIGVDWLVQEKAAIYIEPKLNDEVQIDFLGMVLQSFDTPENLDHLEGLFQIDYDSPWIRIPEQKDRLSPILIVQFLKLLQRIVRKGLKKSYYRITQNLNNRVKGKILVGQQIKENVFKNRLTKTMCNYQVFGINSPENKFLKTILEFVSSYLNQKSHIFSAEQNLQLNHVLSYCRPAFELVETIEDSHMKIQTTKNVFYGEYEEAIKIGRLILKRFSFNINRSSQTESATPPFWIDMSKLFEIYVFGKLRNQFPERGSVTYHDNFKGGKQTDILIRTEGSKCVIDCKYKPQYKHQSPSLDDKRQLAGYTRLKSVYDRLEVPHEILIKGLIIYPNQECNEEIAKESLFDSGIEEYVEFYKLGIKLPYIKTNQTDD